MIIIKFILLLVFLFYVVCSESEYFVNLLFLLKIIINDFNDIFMKVF